MMDLSSPLVRDLMMISLHLSNGGMYISDKACVLYPKPHD